MATSGTYARNPTAGELALQAFVRAGVPRTEVTSSHISDAQMEANLMMAALSNDVPHLWTSETYTVPLLAATSTYALPERILDIQTAYISTTSGSVTTDRTIEALSTSEYAQVPNKAQAGAPTAYWFDKQITPNVVVWPVPASSSVYTLGLRCLSRFQDTLLANGTDVEVPYRFIDAFTWGLAARLALIYKPDKAEALGRVADAQLQKAKDQDTDSTPIRVSVAIGGYWR